MLQCLALVIIEMHVQEGEKISKNHFDAKNGTLSEINYLFCPFKTYAIWDEKKGNTVFTDTIMFHFPVVAQMKCDRYLLLGGNALYFEDYVLSIQYFNQVYQIKALLAETLFYKGDSESEFR